MLSTLDETAKLLHVSRSTIKRMISDGRIPERYTVKLSAGRNGAWRLNAEAIERHLLEQSLPPGEQWPSPGIKLG